MDCPNCKWVNPPTAVRCDCGYDFQMHTIQRSYLTERDKRLRRGAGGAGVALLISLVTEAALRLRNEAVATHSFEVMVLTVAVVVALLGLWVWLLKYR